MQRLRGIILALILIAACQTAQAESAPPPPPGRQLITEYEAQSNAVRGRLTEAYKLPMGPERDAQIEDLKRQYKALDAAAVPIVVELMADGFWRPVEGRDAVFDSGVWLIVQHSGDLDLQQRTLDELEPLVAAGAFDGQQYGLLFDRVAVKQGRPQRFGTQLVCKDGRFVAEPIEDAQNLDDRRQKYGFVESHSEYLASFKDLSC